MTQTILVLAANPTDIPRLRLEQEVREIDNGLRRSPNRDEFELKQQWAVRISDIRRAMLEFEPDIVHFCGHGAGEEGIAFEDDSGHTKFVGAEALSGFFQLFSEKLFRAQLSYFEDIDNTEPVEFIVTTVPDNEIKEFLIDKATALF